MTSLHERLTLCLPVNKAAALHTAGGDRTGREELEWGQFDTFEAMLAKLPNWRSQQTRARLADVAPRVAAELGWSVEGTTRHIRDLIIAVGRLASMKPRSYAAKDYGKYVDKMWLQFYEHGRLNKRLRQDLKLAVNGDHVPTAVRREGYRKSFVWPGVAA